MPPLLETMKRDAALARIERLETTLKMQSQAMRLIAEAIHHHISDRHQAAHADEGRDLSFIRATRRVLVKQAGANDIATVHAAETAKRRKA